MAENRHIVKIKVNHLQMCNNAIIVGGGETGDATGHENTIQRRRYDGVLGPCINFFTFFQREGGNILWRVECPPTNYTNTQIIT